MSSKIKRTRLSPSPREMGWLIQQLQIINPKSFLEFGAGLTSKAIYDYIHPSPYVIIENYEPLTKLVPIELPEAHLITTTWEEIPQHKYDVVLIDSSAGYPPAPTQPALRRLDALKWCIKYNLIGEYVIIHDAFARSGKHLYQHLSKCPDFQTVSTKRGKSGFAIFSLIQ